MIMMPGAVLRSICLFYALSSGLFVDSVSAFYTGTPSPSIYTGEPVSSPKKATTESALSFVQCDEMFKTMEPEMAIKFKFRQEWLELKTDGEKTFETFVEYLEQKDSEHGREDDEDSMATFARDNDELKQEVEEEIVKLAEEAEGMAEPKMKLSSIIDALQKLCKPEKEEMEKQLQSLKTENDADLKMDPKRLTSVSVGKILDRINKHDHTFKYTPLGKQVALYENLIKVMMHMSANTEWPFTLTEVLSRIQDKEKLGLKFTWKQAEDILKPIFDQNQSVKNE